MNARRTAQHGSTSYNNNNYHHENATRQSLTLDGWMGTDGRTGTTVPPSSALAHVRRCQPKRIHRSLKRNAHTHASCACLVCLVTYNKHSQPAFLVRSLTDIP
eukprot:GHVU01118127.1.p1 GENE.GHVU01118127.1~~GHVU01118127.1.p1  ORF type:complete len:103 (-),score=7.12 GHVU01118127.1:81-389(-)